METIYIFGAAAHEADLARVCLDRKLEELPESDDSIKEELHGFLRPSFVKAVEEYRGKSGTGKSQRAMKKRLESHARSVYSQCVVDESFTASYLMRVLLKLEAEASEQNTNEICLHLVLQNDIRVVKVSNILMSMLQGILVPEGTDKMWLKPPNASLTLQIEFGEVSEADRIALAPCDLFGEVVDTVASFQLGLVAAETAGALQPSTQQDIQQTSDFMRKSISLARYCCLQFRDGQAEPFNNVGKPNFPAQIPDLSDADIPRAICDLCRHFGMGFPNEKSSMQCQLELNDYRHMAQICRLLAVRLELFRQLNWQKHAWKVQVIAKECFVSILGLQQDPGAGASPSIKHGLFRQPLAFCLLNLLPDMDDRGNRFVSEEYMLLNVDDQHACMRRLIEKCDQKGDGNARERTIDYADSIEGQQSVLPHSADWQSKLASTIHPLSMEDEGTGFQIHFENGQLHEPGQVLSPEHFPLTISLLGKGAFNKYVEHKCRLRQKLGIALDLPDTSEVRQIVEGRGFVLTADVVAKAVVLKHRMQLGMNVVLQGHTGVGKTEIVELLQHFFSSRLTSLVHPLRADRVAQLKAILPPEFQARLTWKGSMHESLAQLADDLHALAETEQEAAVSEWAIPLSNILRETKDLSGALPAPSDPDEAANGHFATNLGNSIDKLLETEPQGTSWIRRAAQCCQHYEDAEPASTFFQELIHPGISYEAFVHVVQKAIGAAEYWRSRAQATGVTLRARQTKRDIGICKGTLRSDAPPVSCFQQLAMRDSGLGDQGKTLQACDGKYLSVRADGGLEFLPLRDPDATCVFQVSDRGQILQNGRCLHRLQDGSVLAAQPAASLDVLEVRVAFTWSSLPWHDKSIGSFQPVVLFLDELNTNKELLPYLTSLFVDRLFDGRAIPSNLFCVGAINPLKEDATIFTVFALPKPMQSLLIDFGELDESMEKKFLYSMLSPAGQDEDPSSYTGIMGLPVDLRICVVGAILDVHTYVRGLIEQDQGNTEMEAMTECQTVTIRDLLRWRKIFLWFFQEVLPEALWQSEIAQREIRRASRLAMGE